MGQKGARKRGRLLSRRECLLKSTSTAVRTYVFGVDMLLVALSLVSASGWWFSLLSLVRAGVDLAHGKEIDRRRVPSGPTRKAVV